MHESTPAVAARIRANSDLRDRLTVLDDAYAQSRCVVVTCGPSLRELPPDRLRYALDSTLTIAVKQAVDVVGEQADFLCFNSFNVTNYRSATSRTIRCLVREPTGLVPQFNRADLVFEQQPVAGDLERSLATTRRFADHPLDATTLRPWGPGIMYELVLHLVVHLGVSEIITVGWDVADQSGRNTHYYDSARSESIFDNERADAFAATPARRRLPPRVRYAARWLRAAQAHQRGELYNHALPVDGETSRVAASTAEVARWLSAAGISLRVVSASPYLSPSIDRLSIDQFFEVLEGS